MDRGRPTYSQSHTIHSRARFAASYEYYASCSFNSLHSRRSSKSEQNTLVLRTEQLEFRRQEVYSAFSAFLSILRHTDQQPPQVELVDGAPIDLSSWRSDGAHTLVECAKDVTLSGHSFGGCTAVSMAIQPCQVVTDPLHSLISFQHRPLRDSHESLSQSCSSTTHGWSRYLLQDRHRLTSIRLTFKGKWRQICMAGPCRQKTKRLQRPSFPKYWS